MIKLPEVSEPITKKLLFSKLNQADVFEYYTHCKVDYTARYKSPVRNDKNPTCSYTVREGNILFKDWNGDFTGDCIKFVQYKYNCTYREALYKIANDFGLLSTGDQKLVEVRREASPPLQRPPKVIQVKRAPLRACDIEYFAKQGVSQRTLANYNVNSLDGVWLDGKLIWSFTPDCPAVIYNNPDGRFKIYFYKKKTHRFMDGTFVQGLPNITIGPQLIITKSMKDVMLLYEFGYSAIAPPGEGIPIPPETIIELQQLYPRLVIFFDNDATGIKNAAKYVESYGLYNMMIPIDSGCKDLCEYYVKFGKEATRNFIITHLSS